MKTTVRLLFLSAHILKEVMNTFSLNYVKLILIKVMNYQTYSLYEVKGSS